MKRKHKSEEIKTDAAKVSLFRWLPTDLKFYMMSFLGNKKNLSALGKTCKEFETLSQNKSLQDFFTPDFSRPGEWKGLFPDISEIALSNDKQNLAMINYASNQIRIVDLATHEIKTTLNGVIDSEREDTVNLHFTENDKYLIVSYHADGFTDNPGGSDIDVWDLATAQKIYAIHDIGNEGEKPSTPSIHVLPNNHFLVSLCRRDACPPSVCPLYLCSVDEKKCIPFAEIEKASFYLPVCVSPNQKVMAQIVKPDPDALVWVLNVYNFESGKKIKTIDLNQSSLPLSLCFGPQVEFLDDNKTLLMINVDTIYRFNLETGDIESSLFTEFDSKHINFINYFWQLPGNCIAMFNLIQQSDKHIIIWNLETNKSIATFPKHYREILWHDETNRLILLGDDDVLETISFPHTLREHLDNDYQVTRMRR